MDMMKKNLVFMLGRMVVYTALVVICTMIIKHDAGIIVDGRKFIESSWTEWTQQSFALLISLSFILIGRKYGELKPVAYLIGGGFVTVLIRELDAYFDHVYQGAWFPLALIAFFTTLYAVFRHRQSFVQSAVRFTESPAFGLFAAGGLCVFVFSRLFGTKGMWVTVIANENIIARTRWVKNAAEEGTELFGYCLLLCSVIELYAFARRRLSVPA